MRNNSPLTKLEMLFFVVALTAIGAALGSLTSTNSQQRLLNMGIGALIGVIVGVLVSLLLSRRHVAANGTEENGETNRKPTDALASTSRILSNTRLTITDVYTKDTIPVQLTLLVSFESLIAPPHGASVEKTSGGRSDPAAKSGPVLTAHEEVVRSLVTTEARRFVLSKTIDELGTSETFDVMGQKILDEANPTLDFFRSRSML